jgi:hypothetical protein
MKRGSYIGSGAIAAGVIFMAFAEESAPITGQWIVDKIGTADQVPCTAASANRVVRRVLRVIQSRAYWA